MTQLAWGNTYFSSKNMETHISQIAKKKTLFSDWVETHISQIAKKNAFFFREVGDPYKPNSKKKDYFFLAYMGLL